jgi:hypothetical protein
MEDLNLHFTGDIHAIGAANNLLAAFIDAHVMHGNELDIDPHTISWRRAVDMNDRGLRSIVTGLGGKTNGSPRETGFDITAASEVMAILALASDLSDLRRRLGAITVAYAADSLPFSFTEITEPNEHHSYNEWHMLDHMPEQYPIAGIAYGQRWVSTPANAAARAVAEAPLDAVHYLTCYVKTEPVEETLRAVKVRPAHIEGYDRADWILMDFFTFIVHIFTPQTRAFYSLERLWGDAERIEVKDPAPAAEAQ